MEQHYYRIINDFFKKTISNEDLAELMLWVDADEKNQQIFRETLKGFEAAVHVLGEPVQQEQSWNKIKAHISREPESMTTLKLKHQKHYWLKIAALWLVVLMLPVMYYLTYKPVQEVKTTYEEIYNPRGQKRLITLPDGSNIYLNSDSKIRYARNFNSAKRIIDLSGEAFFDVQHDPKKPFIVYTGKISTTVLGTSFNISSYPSDQNISVSVQTGKVGVTVQRSTGQQVHFLLPDQQLNIDKGSLSVKQKRVNIDHITGWREYKLTFENQPLSAIAEVLAREYDLEISIENPALRKVNLTAKFNKSSAIGIFDIISQLTHSKYTIHGKKVMIYQ